MRKTPTFWASGRGGRDRHSRVGAGTAKDHVKAAHRAGAAAGRPDGAAAGQPQSGPPTSGPSRPAVGRRRGAPRARAQPGHPGAAARAAAARPSGRGAVGDLPAEPDVEPLHAGRDEPADQPAAGGSAAARSPTTPCSGTPACRRISAGAAARWRRTSTIRGSRRPTSAATRNPAYTSNIQAQYTQPLLRNFKIDPTRSSAADPDAAVADHRSQPARDADDHRSPGSQRLLGSGVRDRQRRSGAPQSRALGEAGAGQPRQGRDRHHGADRRRPGAGRRGDAGGRRWSTRKPRAGPTSWR